MPRVRTSRRVAPLQDTDIDHEIALVDHSAAMAGSTRQSADLLSPTRSIDLARSASPASGSLSLTPSSLPRGTTIKEEDEDGEEAFVAESSHPDVEEESGKPLGKPENEAGPSSTPAGVGKVTQHQPMAKKEGSSREPSQESTTRISYERRKSRGRISQSSIRSKVSNYRMSRKYSPRFRRPPSYETDQDNGAAVGANGKHGNRRPESPDNAIDVLYENERGLILCGLPLFSAAALGNLDPPPWTNRDHRPSPTSPRTAQVPDPSWEWTWPEWRINRDGEDDDCGALAHMDVDGWEYSFMFAKRFSWHGPRWWNSFVRRRAWTRKRVKKRLLHDGVKDDELTSTNPTYFSVGHSSKRTSVTKAPHRTSLALTTGNNRSSTDFACTIHDEDVEEADEAARPVIVRTGETLLVFLRRSRIDREKLDAVRDYLDHASDRLAPLQQTMMHDTMKAFVFQAGRRNLLTMLIECHDQAVAELERRQQAKGKEKEEEAQLSQTTDKVQLPKTETQSVDQDGGGKANGGEPCIGSTVLGKLSDQELQTRVDNLAGAVQHAGEEVRRLEYWSDVKGMAENGAVEGAVDPECGWDQSSYEGIGRGGPLGANREMLPGGSGDEGEEAEETEKSST